MRKTITETEFEILAQYYCATYNLVLDDISRSTWRFYLRQEGYDVISDSEITPQRTGLFD